jgi:hypothetical protein
MRLRVCVGGKRQSAEVHMWVSVVPRLLQLLRHTLARLACSAARRPFLMRTKKVSERKQEKKERERERKRERERESPFSFSFP